MSCEHSAYSLDDVINHVEKACCIIRYTNNDVCVVLINELLCIAGSKEDSQFNYLLLNFI